MIECNHDFSEDLKCCRHCLNASSVSAIPYLLSHASDATASGATLLTCEFTEAGILYFLNIKFYVSIFVSVLPLSCLPFGYLSFV